MSSNLRFINSSDVLILTCKSWLWSRAAPPSVTLSYLRLWLSHAICQPLQGQELGQDKGCYPQFWNKIWFATLVKQFIINCLYCLYEMMCYLGLYKTVKFYTQFLTGYNVFRLFGSLHQFVSVKPTWNTAHDLLKISSSCPQLTETGLYPLHLGLSQKLSLSWYQPSCCQTGPSLIDHLFEDNMAAHWHQWHRHSDFLCMKDLEGKFV